MPPGFAMLGTPSLRGKMSAIPGKWCPQKVRRDRKSLRDSKFTTRSEFLPRRCIFSTAGSFRFDGQGLKKARKEEDRGKLPECTLVPGWLSSVRLLAVPVWRLHLTLGLRTSQPYDCNPHIKESPHTRAPKSPKIRERKNT